ncbi:hypothetical protein [Paraburkholderia bannensis]|uniref:hypothetical protein n=1 Tax=Paraburkholderia bannensis TaxID=765414 RepID=UPI002ABE9378|nr:hypothetical protein [Paraburkholderia bannensis]
MLEGIVGWLSQSGNTATSAIVTGVAGFIAKGIYDLQVQRRKEKLERINQQLKLLYGPLYSLSAASGLAWKEFQENYWPDRQTFFSEGRKMRPGDLALWRLWMRSVFQPINEAMCEAIEKNSELLIENDVPTELSELLAHTEVYKTVIARWDAEDYSEHLASFNYPSELEAYVNRCFLSLKEQQRKLIGYRVPAVKHSGAGDTDTQASAQASLASTFTNREV